MAPNSAPQLIGNTLAMRDLKAQLHNAAPTDLPVLILGPPGAGKSHAAAYLHHISPRRPHALVTLDCGRLRPAQIEHTLSQTVAQALDGTLVLDWLDGMPLEGQTRLLHALESHFLLPNGLDPDHSSPTRLVGIANQPLMSLMQAGRFRADLFFRLQGYMVTLPPLEQRREDIPLLVQHFARHHAPDAPPFNTAEIAALQTRAWPGHVAELENAVEVLMADKHSV